MNGYDKNLSHWNDYQSLVTSRRVVRHWHRLSRGAVESVTGDAQNSPGQDLNYLLAFEQEVGLESF